MASELLDDFTDASSWMAVASGLAELRISSDPVDARPSMRLEFDFHGGGGFVVARKVFSRHIPESYSVSFAIRGAAPANRLELKLADASGRNVWWHHWDAFEFPSEWRTIAVRSRDIEFAWGPQGGGALSQLGAIELAITAAPGGAGTVWIADLRLEDRTYRSTPVVHASSARPGCEPARALDGDPATSWLSDATAAPQWVEIDFGEQREYGGLVVTWAPRAAPRAFRVETSGDGTAWATVHAAEATDLERSFVSLPDAVSRFLRLALEPRSDSGCGIAEVLVQPFEFSRSPNAFFEAIARLQPRGYHPRWLAGEQSYWTCIGVADGDTCALINEEGLVEVDRGTFSIEPFVRIEGRLLTWADADISQTLVDDWVPVPSSIWRADDLTLRTTAFACRRAGRAILFLRYQLENGAARPRDAQLFAALRPFQVNPPWQAFGELGGMRKIERLVWDGTEVRVDGSRSVIPLSRPCAFGGAPFAEGEIPIYLASGTLPPATDIADAFGYASGALAFDIALAAGETREVFVAIPFGAAETSDVASLGHADAAEAYEETVRTWHEYLGAIGISVPPAGRDYADTARTAAAQVLINRDGPALQPGPRRYTRSWIRDGAVMAAALLRLGRHAEAVEFTRWYATYQAADGTVPCCVDRNGPDWLVEHDSHGELIFAVMECFRFSRDRAFLAELWPAVRNAVAHLDALRATRSGPEFDAPELRARRGLLPESASHEGYLAHPVHSYWDAFWALQGYQDAAEMAGVLGEDDDARRIAASADDLAAALKASIETTVADRSIAYVPGSVEWADFDPTATSIAVGLLDCIDVLPRAALEHTFDQYLAGFRGRRDGSVDWNNYSAYEVRIIGALVGLDRRDDAAELAEFLLADRRPRVWNQWPEISWRNPRSPGHLGDVPHTWIGAEYVLAFRSLFAYERRADRSLVVAAGIPAAWLDNGARVGVQRLPTYYGALDFEMQRGESGAITVSLAGDLNIPDGGIVLRPPLAGPLTAASVNGADVALDDAESLKVAVFPAIIVLRT